MSLDKLRERSLRVPADSLHDGLDPAAIREQLERMLSNPLFRHSKRYPHLFRTVVEQALERNTDLLKERFLGVHVFGRDAGYDTNLDPIVRTTAGEIRRRIAQYYHEEGHEAEIRIELLPGSYIPEFRWPSGKAVTGAAPAAPAVKPAGPIAVVEKRPRRLVVGSRVALGLAVVLLAILLYLKPWAAKPALDRFWTPVIETPSPVLLCVGPPYPGAVPKDLQPKSLGEYLMSEVQHVALADATTLARVAGLLQTKGKPFRIRAQGSTDLADLRDGPVVLIGAFNNDWTIRLTGQLRYTFEGPAGAGTFWIQDRKNPGQRPWTLDMFRRSVELTDDYAIVSRVLDATTGRLVVVAGGIANYGTLAAGEFLTDPRLMEEVAARAPRNWDRKNLQVVLETRLIEGSAGRPRIVATDFW